MAWILVGLGNPGDEYEGTRHNTGRLALEYFAKVMKFSEWKEDKRSKARISRGMIDRTIVALVAPDTFMNRSGSAVAKFVKNPKAAERMVVVYDDVDLPLGTLKVSFERGSGGHKGLESVVRAVKTKRFARVRIGISPSTASGITKKPEGEKEVNKFILSQFKPHEYEALRRLLKRVVHALETIVLFGPERAMNQYN